MATLSDFPIGTSFHYLGYRLIVIEHHEPPGRGSNCIICHYAPNVSGMIFSISFSAQSFDYLKAVIDDQRRRESKRDDTDSWGPSA
jgi:hypothetical protein